MLLLKRQWGSDAHCHPWANSGGRRLMKKGKKSFIQNLHNLEEWQVPALIPYPLDQPEENPATPCQTSPRLYPQFLLPFKDSSFGNHRWLVAQSSKQLSFFLCHCWAWGSPPFQSCHGPHSLQNQQGPSSPGPHVCEVGPGGREGVSPFPLFKSSNPNFAAALGGSRSLN